MDWQHLWAAIVAEASSPPQLLWDAAHSDVVAYWAQGFGSIAAVGVAIYVPWKIQNRAMKEAREERDLKARSLAILIWPAVLELKVLIARAVEFIEMELAPNRDLQLLPLVDAVSIELPSILSSSIDRLWWLGEKAAPPMLQLVAVAEQYQQMLNQIRDRAVSGQGAYDAPRVREILGPHLKVIKQSMVEIESTLGPIHDAGQST